MPSPNLTRRDEPLGPLRDIVVPDISSEDYERPEGFVCQATSAGNISYRTLHGIVDLTEPVAAGDAIGVAGVACALSAVRSTSTVTIKVGIV